MGVKRLRPAGAEPWLRHANAAPCACATHACMQAPSAPIRVPAVQIIPDYVTAPSRQHAASQGSRDAARAHASLPGSAGASALTRGSGLPTDPHTRMSQTTSGSLAAAHGGSPECAPGDTTGGYRPTGQPSAPVVIRTSWSSKDMKVSFSLPGSSAGASAGSPSAPRLRRQVSGVSAAGTPCAPGSSVHSRPSASPPTPVHGSMAHAVGSVGKPPLPRTSSEQRAKAIAALPGSSPGTVMHAVTLGQAGASTCAASPTHASASQANPGGVEGVVHAGDAVQPEKPAGSMPGFGAGAASGPPAIPIPM